jgi:uncharacterized protein YqgV (UPF0045/DUF77 family)
MRRHRSAAVAALSVILAVAATGCAPSRHDAAAQHHSATTSTKPGPSILLRSGVSNGQSYLVWADTADGATADGHGRWNTRTARLAGQHAGTGDPAVIAAFNNASVDATQGLVDAARRDAAPDASWTNEVRPSVTFLPAAVSAVMKAIYVAARAAHAVRYVATIVIDSRTGRHITLKALFRNEQVGLQRLSEQMKLIWPTVYGNGSTEPMPDLPGNRPREENFANWIPTADGVEIHFADDQLGPGLREITVPWSALTDVLAPDLAALAH